MRRRPAAASAGHFAALPGFRLHLLARLSERYAELLYWRKFKLRMPEVRVIGVIGDRGNAPFGRVCRDTELDKSQASRLVARLARRGLLKRASDPADSRSVQLSLTARGRKLRAALYQDAVERNRRLFGILDATQSTALVESVEALMVRARALWMEELGHGDGPAMREPLVLAAGADFSPPASIVLDAEVAGELYRLIGSALGRAPVRKAQGSAVEQ